MTIRYFRHVTDVQGNTLTVDAPVFNHLKRELSPSTVYRYDNALLREIGVENLFIDIGTQGETSENHAKDGLVFRNAQDCWARNVTVRHFVAAGIKFGPAFARGTALDCRAVDPHSEIKGSRRYNFCVYQAQLVLFEKCYASHARHAFISNGTTLDSGIVVLDCVNEFSITASEGHRRWAQGLLFDGLETRHPVANTVIIGLWNRGDWGIGHGWGAAHSVAWRCDAGGGRVVVQKPPTAQNYAIGCLGEVSGQGNFEQPAGYIEGTGRPGLQPRSLYRAQLAERLKMEKKAVSP